MDEGQQGADDDGDPSLGDHGGQLEDQGLSRSGGHGAEDIRRPRKDGLSGRHLGGAPEPVVAEVVQKAPRQLLVLAPTRKKIFKTNPGSFLALP